VIIHYHAALLTLAVGVIGGAHWAVNPKMGLAWHAKSDSAYA